MLNSHAINQLVIGDVGQRGLLIAAVEIPRLAQEPLQVEVHLRRICGARSWVTAGWDFDPASVTARRIPTIKGYGVAQGTR